MSSNTWQSPRNEWLGRTSVSSDVHRCKYGLASVASDHGRRFRVSDADDDDADDDADDAADDDDDDDGLLSLE